LQSTAFFHKQNAGQAIASVSHGSKALKKKTKNSNTRKQPQQILSIYAYSEEVTMITPRQLHMYSE